MLDSAKFNYTEIKTSIPEPEKEDNGVKYWQKYLYEIMNKCHNKTIPVERQKLPDFEIDLNNRQDFKEKMLLLAAHIYPKYDEDVKELTDDTKDGYDPYKGGAHAFCEGITDDMIDYLHKKGVECEKREQEV